MVTTFYVNIIFNKYSLYMILAYVYKILGYCNGGGKNTKEQYTLIYFIISHNIGVVKKNTLN